MTRPQFFIISSAIIFLLERILPTLISWPVFIFPVFVILFELLSTERALSDLYYIAIAALFFDFFSGFTFGLMTVAILAVSITIYLAKIFFNVDGRSPILPFALSLVFVFEYFFLLSIKTSPRLVISQAPLILAEAVIVLIPTKLLLQKFLNPKP